MMFSVWPSALNTAIEERMARGIEMAMMRVLFQSPKKRRIMIAVKHAAITVSRTTPSIAPVTKMD